MSKNLSVAIYADGTPIPQIADPNDWAALTTGAWCWYNNDSATYAATYGRLYNWFAVVGIYDSASDANPALRKQLAPAGWHVPSVLEWHDLTNYLGGADVAGGKMKATGTIQAATGLWRIPNAEATNSSGFSGAPGGFRNVGGVEAGYQDIGNRGNWWSSSEQENNGDTWFRLLYWFDGNAYGTSGAYKQFGLSVRCIRD
jgi:uncharacterized protein (TIGR02145 family)